VRSIEIKGTRSFLNASRAAMLPQFLQKLEMDACGFPIGPCRDAVESTQGGRTKWKNFKLRGFIQPHVSLGEKRKPVARFESRLVDFHRRCFDADLWRIADAFEDFCECLSAWSSFRWRHPLVAHPVRRRSNKETLIRRSRPAIPCVTPGCDKWTTFDAALMLSSRATASKIRSCRREGEGRSSRAIVSPCRRGVESSKKGGVGCRAL
jgi:hypothetical protein